jgi:dUTP pyrophosphatase
MVIQRVEYAQFVAGAELSDSVRGDGGFGSTGGFGVAGGVATPQA